MSEGLRTESSFIENDHKESIVDIYVSVESLRVYDTPWVDEASQKSQELASPKPAVSCVQKMSVKRSYVRSDAPSLRVLCPVLLIVIVYLVVKMDKDKTTWGQEKKDLLSNNTELMKVTAELTTNYTELMKERDLESQFGEETCKKCRRPACKND
ncbi:uncharacterized protein ACNS7B_000740 [Menidia menidia]